MVNGTKLLNVTGMSRGKRDGILKNEKGRVVVKVGAMHLKGVWVTFTRAKALAIQFNIVEHLHPLFVDDPALYFYSNQMTPHNYFIPNHPIYLHSQDSFSSTNTSLYPNHHTNSSSSTTSLDYHYHLPSAPSVPSMIPPAQQQQQSLYGYNNNSATTAASSVTTVNEMMNPF